MPTIAKKSASVEDLRNSTAKFTQDESTAKVGGSTIKYDLKPRVYPSETSIAEDVQHYIAFFINVRGKSRAFTNAKGTAVPITGADSGSFDRANAGKRLQESIPIAATAAGLALTQSLYAKVASNFGTSGAKVKVIGQAAALLAGGVAANAIGEKLAELFQPDKRYRIADAVMLAMQERPSVRYGVEYMATDMGTLTGALAGGASGLAFNEMLPEIARKGLLNLGQIPAAAAGMAVGENLDIKNLASVTSAMAPNPFREQIFQSVDTRTFTFDYKFLPKSQQESENVRNILHTFSYHMHPELSDQGLFYIYPSEFNIQFYHQGRENRWLNRISTCVLTDMSVDYGNNSVFSTFRNGAPSEINMRLTFRELEVLTKERLQTWHDLPVKKV